MKKRTIYNERLAKFASHLLSIQEHPEQGLYETANIFEFDNNVKYEYEIKFPIWAFEELVLVFPEFWSFDEHTGALTLEGANYWESTLAMVIDFFDLSVLEISAFDLEGDTIEGYGKPLKLDAGSHDIALNILQIIQTRENE